MLSDEVVTDLLDGLARRERFTVARRAPIRIWELSGVERLHLTNGATVIYKYASAPFAGEDRTLRHLAAHRVPVPRLYASTNTAGTLGMIMEDLGPATRDATEQDAATAAAQLHALGAAPGLDTLNDTTLPALPARSLHHLQHLPKNSPLNTPDITENLHALNTIAAEKAADATLPPFGICHSELHPTSLHITNHRWHLLDLAKAFNGPGILDLATWHGTRTSPDPPRLRRLLNRYIHAGGHPHALTNRAGLPAETWALAWHRIWAATTLIQQTTPTHPNQQAVNAIRRQLTTALQLLTDNQTRQPPSAAHGP